MCIKRLENFIWGYSYIIGKTTVNFNVLWFHHTYTFFVKFFWAMCVNEQLKLKYTGNQGSDWTELKSSVQFKSSLFWWTLYWTQFTFLLKELELNLVHLLSDFELKWTEKFSSFFYLKNQGFLAYFWSKNTDTIGILLQIKEF